MSNPLVQPLFNGAQLTLPEHKLAEVLAKKMYLILSYREGEAFPFGFMLMRGADIVVNDLPDHYRYYLLPQ
ncbi:MAG: hypothetical protein ACJ741_06565 [Pyrinomonadaceae bacterium]